MKRLFALSLLLTVAAAAYSQEFNTVPKAWKWISDHEAVFTYDGTYADSTAFSVDSRCAPR